MKLLAPVLLSLLVASVAPNASAHGGVRHFCTPGASGSRISASGSASFAVQGGSGDLVLHASNVPAGRFGQFVYGSAATPPTPFGSGFRCVGGAVFRLPIVGSGPAGGSLALALDYLDPPSAAGAITPGSTWSFQCWFRSGANLDSSDALRIHFGPPETLTPWTSLLQGFRSSHLYGQTGGGVVVITTPARWATFWSAHTQGWTPPPPPPQVDFTRHSVVAVFSGFRGMTGYSIGVEQLRLSVATVHVRTLEHRPGFGCGGFFVEQQPFHFVLVPRIEHLTFGDWNPLVVYNPPCP